MTMRSRQLHIAVVFVWALAHGVWMGAGMHAFTALGSSTPNKGEGRAVCATCVHYDASSESIANAAAAGDACAVCKLSTVLPEVASIHTPITFEPLPAHTAPLALEEGQRSITAHLFPLAHAPPV
jgi:hypothetical protein